MTPTHPRDVTQGSLALAGIALAGPSLMLAGADSATFPLAMRYARIIFAGLIAMEMVPSVGFIRRHCLQRIFRRNIPRKTW